MNKKFTENSFNNSKLTIEKSISNIFDFLVANTSENSVVVKEKLLRWSSSAGIISIYPASDYKKVGAKDSKGCSRATATFAFYPSIYDNTKLGSVAIYGTDVRAYLESLKKTTSMFGYPIKEVRAEMGMRLFVDVKFTVSHPLLQSN